MTGKVDLFKCALGRVWERFSLSAGGGPGGLPREVFFSIFLFIMYNNPDMDTCTVN